MSVSSNDQVITCVKALETQGMFSDALRLIDENQSLDRDNSDASARNELALHKAWINFRMGNYGEACLILDQLLAENTTPSPGLAETYMFKANCLGQTHLLDEAEELMHKAIAISREVGAQEILTRALHNLAVAVYLPRGQFSLCLATEREALKMVETHHFTHLLVPVYVSMAQAFWLMAQDDQIRVYLDKLHRIQDFPRFYQGWLFYLDGLIPLVDRDFDASLTAFMHGLSFAAQTGDPGLNVLLRVAIAQLYRLKKDYIPSLEWAEDAVSYASRVGYKHMLGTALIEKGKVLVLQGSKEEAEQSLRQALEILMPQRMYFEGLRGLRELVSLKLSQRSGPDSPIDPEVKSLILELVSLVRSQGFGNRLSIDTGYAIVKACLDSKDPELKQPGLDLLQLINTQDPLPLHISLLGRLHVRRGNRDVEDASLRLRKSGELLALLATHSTNGMMIEEAAECLQPGSSPSAAFNLVYHAISSLRRALEPELLDRRFPSQYIVANAGYVELTLPPGSTIDARTFEDLDTANQLLPAYTLYLGDFLPEFAWSEWTIPLRDRLSDRYSRLLIRLAQKTLTEGNPHKSLDYCSQLISRDPLHEQAVYLAMQANQAIGDSFAARNLYTRFASKLASALDLQPSEALTNLFIQLG